MVDISAKWGSQLYKEAVEQVGQVALPKETVEYIMKTDIPTPEVTQYKPRITNPITTLTDVIFKNPLEEGSTFDIIKDYLIGTPEEKTKSLTTLLPVEIDTRTVEIPEQLKIEIPEDFRITPVELPETIGGATKTVNITELDTPKLIDEGVITKTEGGYTYNIYPTDITYVQGETTDITGILTKIIDAQKQSSEDLKKFWETATLGTTNIELPEINIPNPLEGITDFFKEAGKWILIGGAVIIGIWAISKLTSKKR